ncbi:hypothetical protein B0W47_15460 [Komagataeibacter nataicola]|uniref:Uncharacterized protein n=1 Tax=Komagataeibacter nataicola TaxID=265960 RepID=A0A9N7CB01_9PROT|nr:hypothetical protein B0W47_15460 [Komagataeibacter nataicola]PYD64855.1 hypothetical protein CDI09_16910 [Komagataeibacter nataicola]
MIPAGSILQFYPSSRIFHVLPLDRISAHRRVILYFLIFLQGTGILLLHIILQKKIKQLA